MISKCSLKCYLKGGGFIIGRWYGIFSCDMIDIYCLINNCYLSHLTSLLFVLSEYSNMWHLNRAILSIAFLIRMLFSNVMYIYSNCSIRMVIEDVLAQ